MPTTLDGKVEKNSKTLARLTRLRITTAPSTSTPWTWNTDFAISRPIVLTSPMDGSPHSGSLNATTLWHIDAVEWAPSTASIASVGPSWHVGFTHDSGRAAATQLNDASGQKRKSRLSTRLRWA